MPVACSAEHSTCTAPDRAAPARLCSSTSLPVPHAVRGDLIKILTRLAKRQADPQNRAKRLDAVLVETTGLADPAPVAQTFFVDDFVKVRGSLQRGQQRRKRWEYAGVRRQRSVCGRGRRATFAWTPS